MATDGLAPLMALPTQRCDVALLLARGDPGTTSEGCDLPLLQQQAGNARSLLLADQLPPLLELHVASQGRKGSGMAELLRRRKARERWLRRRRPWRKSTRQRLGAWLHDEPRRR
ncbi:hypothetical protein [Mumia zhuanghuii]|uniref:Uncharacterized protein n=1 Tax=Mumia zhuanghuii TaxID=2585211 RepID=A0A5C4M7C8_9ACTN|nr:hypothetical protein [Mumia zhuanghuii]TNC28416.1 hypothetical protein FHE65_33895 [Mumia zhuanghuii]